jgi:hypothetical protein
MICQHLRDRQMMSVEDFCVRLETLGLSGANNAVSILWFQSEYNGAHFATSGELTRIIRKTGLGNPNSTAVASAIRRTGHVLCTGDKFSIKPTSREKIKATLSSLLAPEAPKIPSDSEFLPSVLCKGTRQYIERIAAQINGCYHCTCYDGASVLCRKLIEILIIEVFEHHKLESMIKGTDGEYFMLSGLITAIVGCTGLSIGRETKQVLRDVKTIGDRSAHNRRYLAVKQDMDNLRLGYRLAVDELLHLSKMK